MPQEFHVLQCYNCSTFQVHQVKKSSNKWNCKICGEKQSIKKVFGKGNGADCRQHVQKLNVLRQEHDEIQALCVCHDGECEEEKQEPGFTSASSYHNTFSENLTSHDNKSVNSVSKWNQYVEDAPEEVDDDIPNPEDNLYTTDGAEFNRSRKRKRKNGSSNKKVMRCHYELDAVDHVPSSHDENIHPSQLNNMSNFSNSVQNFTQTQPSRFHANSSQTTAKFSLQTLPNGKVTDISSSVNLDTNHKQFEVLKSINQTRLPNYSVKTNPIKSKKTDPVKTKSVSGTKKGSKWDQYVEEEEEQDSEVSDRDSVEDQKNIHLVNNHSVDLQHPVNAHLPKPGKMMNPMGLFCINDLGDSDLDI